MSYLIDTCVVSELIKKSPDESVTEWIRQQRETDLFLSVVTAGELKKGIAALPEGKRKHQLDAWLMNNLLSRFSTRFIQITPAISLEWGSRSGQLKQTGLNITMSDGLIGATAALHSLVLVTRNTEDFEPLGISLFNPWSDTD